MTKSGPHAPAGSHSAADESVRGVPTLRASRWLIANLLAYPVGGFIGGAVGQSMESGWEGLREATGAARALTFIGAISAGCLGIAIGLGQWLALRGTLRHSGWWLPATAFGWSAAGAIGGGLSGLIGGTVTDVGPQRGLGGFVIASVVGIISLVLLPGLGQWIVLRRTSPRAGRWILAHLAGLVAAIAVVLPVMFIVSRLVTLPIPSGGAWALAGGVVGLGYGVVTYPAMAHVLVKMIPSPRPASDRSASRRR